MSSGNQTFFFCVQVGVCSPDQPLLHTEAFTATLASLRLALWIPGFHVASRSKNIALKIKALSRAVAVQLCEEASSFRIS